MRQAVCAWLLACTVVAAQGTDTKKTPEEYPVHGAAGETRIAAEYNVRSVSAGTVGFITDDYLVVEAALFPPRGGMTVNNTAWALRINGKKELILAQAPAMVAASLKYPDWNGQRGVVAAAGPIIFGQPGPTPRFPGDNRRTPMPRTGQVDQPAEEPGEDIGLVLERVSLPEGPRKQPVSGLVFFPWRGNLKKIKSVELLYTPDEKSAPTVLKLR